MAGGEADVGVEGGRKMPQQGDGGFGAAFFDALDLVGSHPGAQGKVGDAEAKRDPPVIDRLPEGQRPARGPFSASMPATSSTRLKSLSLRLSSQSRTSGSSSKL